MKAKSLAAKMSARLYSAVILAAALAALVAGCDRKPPTPVMPEVNDENCKFENIKKIEDKDMQKQFGSLCARRGSFKPSNQGGSYGFK